MNAPQEITGALPACLAPYAGEKRFVGWRWEKRRNKDGEESWTKPPRSVSGGRLGARARNDDPKTWGTLAEAQEAVEKDRAEGIGLQLLDLIGFAAIDLDDVRDPSTGAILPWASRLVEESRSYAELTPSGKGLRILGTVAEGFPTTHTKKAHGEGGEFEVYANVKTGRYITVSGDRLPSVPDALAPLDAILLDLLEVKPPPADAARRWRDFNDAPRQGDASSFDAGGDLPAWLLDKIAHGETGDRSADFQSVANSLFIRGVSFEEALRLFEDHPNGPAEKYAGRLEAELRRSWGKAQASAGSVSHKSHVSHRKLEAPTPLVRETPAPEPFPVAALGPLREAAEALHDMTQAPPAIGANSVLGVAALAAQGIADAETLHGPAPASIFLLTVAQSGERKSACDRLAMAPVREFEAELADAWREARMLHRNALDVWETSRRDILRTAKKDPAGARADLDALGPEPEAPLMPSIVAAEPTLEGIAKNMPMLRPALGIFADEGGSFLGGHSMATENRLRTISGLSSLWDGSPLARWRAGDGVSVFRGRRLSAHLMAQPVAVAGFLADPLAAGQGIIARFLIAEPASAIGTRLQIGHNPASDAALARFAARIGELLRYPLPVREGSRNELEPPVLALTADARGALQEFALELEKEQAAGRELENVRPFASKAAEHAARLAAVLTLYANPGARAVTGETMADAITLATFYVNEAERLADAAIVSAETADAERMRRWLLESWNEPFISAGDAAQRGPFKETARTRKALNMLAQYGWLIAVKGGADILGNRRREAWRVVREGSA